MIVSGEQVNVISIRDHYDRISFFYGSLWGNHIHHGYFDDCESPAVAQLRLNERLAERARIIRGSRVLDVGSGLGGSALWLARKLDCSVLGLTISPVQEAMATEIAGREGLSRRVRFKVADANQLSIDFGSFDVVWVIECSEHLEDKAKFITACARLLKPGGSLALCAWLCTDTGCRDYQQLIQSVCRGMLCPSLASMSDFTDWIRMSGLDRIEAEDITDKVRETWSLCGALVRRKEIASLLKIGDGPTQRFVESFSSIQQAYDVGAMAYGMFTARKPLDGCG